jgi:hypothetical protein
MPLGMDRYCWPQEDATLQQLQLMVRLALEADPNWQPPELFAFTIDQQYDLIDFKHKREQMQRHVEKLVNSMPAHAVWEYYWRHAADAGLRLQAVLLHLKKRELLDRPQQRSFDIMAGICFMMLDNIRHGVDIWKDVAAELPPELLALLTPAAEAYQAPPAVSRLRGILGGSAEIPESTERSTQ